MRGYFFGSRAACVGAPLHRSDAILLSFLPGRRIGYLCVSCGSLLVWVFAGDLVVSPLFVRVLCSFLLNVVFSGIIACDGSLAWGHLRSPLRSAFHKAIAIRVFFLPTLPFRRSGILVEMRSGPVAGKRQGATTARSHTRSKYSLKMAVPGTLFPAMALVWAQIHDQGYRRPAQKSVHHRVPITPKLDHAGRYYSVVVPETRSNSGTNTSG